MAREATAIQQHNNQTEEKGVLLRKRDKGKKRGNRVLLGGIEN